MYGEDERNPEEPQHAVELKVEEVLRLVVMPVEQGRYHFDEMGMEARCSIPISSAIWVAHLSQRGRALPEKASPTGMSS